MPPFRSSKTVAAGYAYVALATLLWAMSGTASKYLFNHGLSAFELVQLRTTISFAGLFCWLLPRSRSMLKIAGKDLLYFFLLGTCGIGAAQFFYLFAISRINVSTAILLHYTGSIFVALYAVLWRHERLGPATVLAIAGTLVGCFFAVGAYNVDLLSANRAGIIGGIGAALAFATYSVLGEYGMRTHNPWTVLFYSLLFAAGLWNILHPPLEAFGHGYSAIEWGWILFIGVFGTILPFGFYFVGVSRIRATHASITATMEPIIAAGMSFIFLGETLGGLQILGGVLAVASIILLQRSRQ